MTLKQARMRHALYYLNKQDVVHEDLPQYEKAIETVYKYWEESFFNYWFVSVLKKIHNRIMNG